MKFNFITSVYYTMWGESIKPSQVRRDLFSWGGCEHFGLFTNVLFAAMEMVNGEVMAKAGEQVDR